MTTPSGRALLALALSAAALTDCSYRIDKTSGGNTQAPVANQGRVLGYNSLRTQIFAPHCITCHGTSGGVSLDSYAGAFAALSRIQNEVVVEKSMPPSGPLADSDQQLVAAWIAAGGPEVDVVNPQPTTPPPAGPTATPTPTPAPSPTPEPSATPSSTPTVTYAQVASQVFGPNCTSCHNQSYAKAGVILDSYSEAVSFIAKVRTEALVDQSMPPSGPLSDANQALLQAWIDAGTPQ